MHSGPAEVCVASLGEEPGVAAGKAAILCSKELLPTSFLLLPAAV